MKTTLRFLGATENVTGSRYLLKTDRQSILVDCGMHQERQLRARDWNPFPVKPSSIDAVLITHAHLDHCGYLPKLVREGFAGPVYCTPATAEIMKISLLDSAHLQESDAENKRKRHEREGRRGPYPEVPLYTVKDAENCFPQVTPISYRQKVEVVDGIAATFFDAGHILGSAMIAVDVQVNNHTRRIIFSGDIGRWDRPIVHNPTSFDQADYIVMESTYGDRIHEAVEDVDNQLEQVIKDTVKARGNIIVPSFAIERAQELLYHMRELLAADRIPHMLVFLDSPMAIKVTEVFRDHPELYDREAKDIVDRNGSPFNFPSLVAVSTADQSKALNYLGGSAMIIAGSGMVTGGRIKHHLVTNITRPESTILFVGYQAVGTLGRIIVDGATEVRLFGQTYPVRARIEQIHGFSSHADQNELLRWLTQIKDTPRRVFVVHGEQESAREFARVLAEKRTWDVITPQYGDEVVID
jgi:metallo-beta-lactamase family protein